MKVDAKALHQAVKNASLFAKKSGWADAVKVTADFQALRLSITTCDDHVGITSSLSYAGAISGEFFISPQSLKDLEKYLRDKAGELPIRVNDSGDMGDHGRVFHIEVGEAEDVCVSPITDCPDPEWWGMFTFVMDHAYAFPEQRGTWEISPDRLTQLSRLEPKGEYPLSLGHCDVRGRACVAFMYGPSTFGMIMPLDREALKKAYGDKLKEVVW